MPPIDDDEQDSAVPALADADRASGVPVTVPAATDTLPNGLLDPSLYRLDAEGIVADALRLQAEVEAALRPLLVETGLYLEATPTDTVGTADPGADAEGGPAPPGAALSAAGEADPVGFPPEAEAVVAGALRVQREAEAYAAALAAWAEAQNRVQEHAGAGKPGQDDADHSGGAEPKVPVMAPQAPDRPEDAEPPQPAPDLAAVVAEGAVPDGAVTGADAIPEAASSSEPRAPDRPEDAEPPQPAPDLAAVVAEGTVPDGAGSDADAAQVEAASLKVPQAQHRQEEAGPPQPAPDSVAVVAEPKAKPPAASTKLFKRIAQEAERPPTTAEPGPAPSGNAGGNDHG
ncbi:hypothetical protein [Methylomagnum ishizawai]|uniref:hypothetical protein n=1 Tax=Methylomagnum ishizawai TaxID=1760988 RepID=UPI001C327867|nr:hypothetical protein [Methylomagnum ishizawai]BBL74899.1 hypothetical protein MishRS11D_19970 [Methylomagnum ishizawai]